MSLSQRLSWGGEAGSWRGGGPQTMLRPTWSPQTCYRKLEGGKEERKAGRGTCGAAQGKLTRKNSCVHGICSRGRGLGAEQRLAPRQKGMTLIL